HHHTSRACFVHALPEAQEVDALCEAAVRAEVDLVLVASAHRDVPRVDHATGDVEDLEPRGALVRERERHADTGTRAGRRRRIDREHPFARWSRHGWPGPARYTDHVGARELTPADPTGDRDRRLLARAKRSLERRP